MYCPECHASYGGWKIINISVGSYKMNMRTSFYYIIVISGEAGRWTSKIFLGTGGSTTGYKKRADYWNSWYLKKCGLWPFLCFLFYLEIPFPMPLHRLALPGLVLYLLSWLLSLYFEPLLTFLVLHCTKLNTWKVNEKYMSLSVYL